MAQFSIRPARPEDCGTILELIRGIAEYEKMSDEVVATEETIRHAMFDEHVTRCLLAELDGKVIGLSLIHISSRASLLAQMVSSWLSMDACSSSVKVRPASAKAFSTQT